MGERPVSVTIFGILNIALAIFGLGSLALSRLLVTLVKMPSNDVLKSLNDNPHYAAWMRVSLVMGVISYTVLLVAGIALLLLKNWGRVTSIVYAIYAIIWSLVGTAMTVVIFRSGAQKSLDHFGSFGIALAIIGTVMGLALSLAYPVLLLIFMTRPNVVAAFRSAAQADRGAIQGSPPTLV